MKLSKFINLRKFLVEGILGHLQGGNYEFENNGLNEYRKIFEKDNAMKCKKKLRRKSVNKNTVFLKFSWVHILDNFIYICQNVLVDFN